MAAANAGVEQDIEETGEPKNQIGLAGAVTDIDEGIVPGLALHGPDQHMNALGDIAQQRLSEEAHAARGDMLIKQRAFSAQVAVVLTCNQAVLQGAHLSRISQEHMDIAQAFGHGRLLVGMRKDGRGFHQMLSGHVAPASIDDLALIDIQSPGGLGGTAVAPVGVECRQHVTDPFLFGHILASRGRFKGIHESGPALAIQEEVEDGNLRKRL